MKDFFILSVALCLGIVGVFLFDIGARCLHVHSFTGLGLICFGSVLFLSAYLILDFKEKLTK